MLLLFFNSLYIIWYHSASCHYLPKAYKLETFNDVIITIVLYHLVMFSDFNLKLETYYPLGYSMTFQLGLITVVNIGGVIHMSLVKFLTIRRQKINKKNYEI